MGVTLLIISAIICGTLAVPLVRERRQYANVYAGTTYSSPYSSYYGTPLQSQETECQIRRRMSEPSWNKPVCNPDGSFREYQCEPYSRFKCWCVYSNGMMIPGSAKDFKDDPQTESKKMNCAAKRASAPKPAPKPPPIKTPYQDRSIGWHLAYRDAAIKNNPYAFYGMYGYPAYGAMPYYSQPQPQPAVTYSAPVSSYSSVSSYTGCPDPCPPPCTCVPGTYRGVLPHANTGHLPGKAMPAADKEEDENEDEPEEEKESDDEPSQDDDDEKDDVDDENDEKNEDDNDKETVQGDNEDKPVEKQKDEPAVEENDDDEEKTKEDKPSSKEEEKKVTPEKKEDASNKKEVKQTKAVAKTKKNDEKTVEKTKDAKKSDKPEEKGKKMDGIDEEDEEDD